MTRHRLKKSSTKQILGDFGPNPRSPVHRRRSSFLPPPTCPRQHRKPLPPSSDPLRILRLLVQRPPSTRRRDARRRRGESSRRSKPFVQISSSDLNESSVGLHHPNSYNAQHFPLVVNFRYRCHRSSSIPLASSMARRLA